MRNMVGVGAVVFVLIALGACSDESSDAGSGGAAGTDAGVGGQSSGGSAGTSTGGSAGTSTGGSAGTSTGGSAGSALYSSAKAFVSTFTRALATELAADGIRVNAVSPGTIATEFHEVYSSSDKLEATRQRIPLQRLGQGDDCAGAFLFLASERLSGYVSG